MGERAAADWSDIPSRVLVAELTKRHGAAFAKADGNDGAKPACGSKGEGHYDTALHVFALLLILTLSTLACGFPLFSRNASQGRRSNRIIFLSQHFGTGVLLATAFVHLLPTAFMSLTDPCLPHIFSKGYKPMAGLVAMVSALVVVAIESYLTTRGAGHSHSHHEAHGWDSDDDNGMDKDAGSMQIQANDGGGGGGRGLALKRISTHRPRDIIALADVGASQGLMADISPLPGNAPITATYTVSPTSAMPFAVRRSNDLRDDHDKDNDDEMDLDIDLDELDPRHPDEDDDAIPLTHPDAPPKLMSANANRHISNTSAPPAPSVPTPEEQKRLTIQCMLLEAGILFHSVFIGMAVSVATGPPFVVFLIAIAFHQTFEGLALGSRIAAIQFPRHSLRPWFMVLAYGTTTPLGQAIGLVVHNMYDPMSQTGLLMVGFMNAISSGLLLFAGLVQLLAEDFLTEKSYRTLRGRNRTHAYIAVVAGAMLMAGVGAFA